jgi:hypothetical protein
MGQIETLNFVLSKNDFKNIFNPKKIKVFHYTP